MTFARTLLLCLLLAGCGPRRPQAPDWLRSAPPSAVMAISCRAGWALKQSRFRDLLDSYPPAGAALDLFIRRTRIDPRQDTGRVTVFLTRPTPVGAAGGSGTQPPGFLIQLGGFRESGKLQAAVADAFPAEGAMSMDNRELPLFGIMDARPRRIRALADGQGRIWLGDEASLAGLGEDAARAQAALAGSAGWISRAAAIQGFIRPQELLPGSGGGLPGDLARDLPRGIESLSWSLTPGLAQDSPNLFELSLSGSPEAVQRVASWLQRFVAAAAAIPGTPVESPEILQEERRIGLRCQLSQRQVDVVLAKLDQPPIRCH
jgi:hypothetical protein